MTVPSLVVCVGRQYYKLHELVEEYTRLGVSKRMPAVIEGMIPGLSKIFVAHPDAIIKVTANEKTLADLAYDLMLDEALSEDQWNNLVELDVPYWTGEDLLPEDFVPECMLDIAIALSREPGNRQKELIEKYGIEFCMGIVGYSHFSGFQLVLPDDVDEVPSEYEHWVTSEYVTPVHVRYADDEENA